MLNKPAGVVSSTREGASTTVVELLADENVKNLSPVGRLKSGFSYASDESGRNIRSVAGVKAGDSINIRVLDGEIHSTVTGTDSL
jgi:exonuclease VII large subunit